MLIRDARPEDLETVIALLDEDAIREHVEDYTDLTPYADALAEIVRSEHATVLVGEVEGTVVATAQVAWLRRMMYGAGLVCQLESVRIASRLRGHGHGSELVRWIIDDARRRGCARVELTSNARRVDARRFYEGLGFTPSHIGMKLYLGQPHSLHARPMTLLHHVQVSCPRGSEGGVRAFYGDLLGLQEVDKPTELALRGGVWFRGPGYELHVGVEDPFAPARKAHPAFLVADVDVCALSHEAAGYAVQWDGNFPGYRRFHTHDPNGNRVEILGRLDPE